LERVREEDSSTRFLIKGGIACELRFQDRARATRDLDGLFRGSLDELLSSPSDVAVPTLRLRWRGTHIGTTCPDALRAS
jgi:hypothetical protein